MALRLVSIFTLIVTVGLGAMFTLIYSTHTFKKDPIELCPSEPSQSVRALSMLNSKRKISYVLVVTHPRSGSTLTGDIIQKYENSFYAFEPLRFAAESMQLGQTVIYLNGTKRNYNYTRDAVWVEADLVYRWFTCDFCRINIKDLKSKFIQSYSTNLQAYAYCLKRNKYGSVSQCVPYLQRTCEKARVRAIKTVRLFSLETISILLKRIPHLKIVYLVRDPRGRLASQAALDPTEWNIVKDQSRTMCTQLHEEIRYLTEIWKLYSEQVKILMYERFAIFPIETSKRLFSFLGLDFDKYLQVFVRSVTSGSVDNAGCYWCTKKTNSQKTAVNWRKSIKYDYVKIIDDQCSDVYHQLGYINIKNEDHLRNTSNSLVSERNLTCLLL
ncbi:carbohydrate sulfotransferase 5-like [Ylistrum balloti]|uniref:carbohydrate sulfotransferase 5-like n=1 Tax=Ylistrum balloti TaxID=509963 RepID=UPI002905C436|nr:carbohydrate sulfotransferase 5-like [Ylistrum balloti]